MTEKESKELSEEEILYWRNYNEEQDIRAKRDFQIGNRPTPLSNNLLSMIGDLLQPQTSGFSHVNMDMTFSYLDRFDIDEVRNSSFIITTCDLLGLKRSACIEKSNLATLLNAKKSQNGQSMSLFNKTVTQSKQELEDKTDKKTGFSFFKRKGSGEE